MKLSIVSLMVLALFTVACAHSENHCERHYDRCSDHNLIWNDHDVSIDYDDGVMVMDFRDRDVLVEITPEYQLYVNDERVKLDDHQQELVRDFYDLSQQVIDEAVVIGAEGAKIGVHGAAIGLQSLSGLLRVILTDYDTDDLERDLERESDRLEAKAKKLEKKAERLEKKANRLEERWGTMCDRIPELDGLD
jgi:Rad3-related DNA helicase